MNDCPSAEQLDALLSERLPEDERPAVEGHVETCRACQDFLGRRVEEDALPFGTSHGDERTPAQDPSYLRDLMASRPEPASPAPPARVPGYEVLGVLGRGGMGVVYKARHLRLKREVALKVLREGDLATEEERARFLAEAGAVARLNHPGIVQVYEAGEHEGTPYLALEYVAGGSLSTRLTGAPLPPRDAAQLIETLARAAHHAHERGIIHRDLKPANVLLGELATDEHRYT